MRFPEVPIGSIFSVVNGATPASSEPRNWDGDVPWVGPADLGKLQSRSIAHGARSISDDGYKSCGTQMVPAGSIIMSTRAPIGHLAIAERELCFNQGCRALIPGKQIRSDYAYWALAARKDILVAAGKGTTFLELSREKLRSAKLPLPDVHTQKAIADFLDRETARIDSLIKKKTGLCETLSEHVQAIIDHEVLGGRSLTDGTVPRVRHVASFSPRPHTNTRGDHLVSFLPMDVLNDGFGGLKEHEAKSFDELSSGSYNYCADGDILLAKVTPCFENGKKALVRGLVNGVGFATSEVHVVRPDPRKIDGSYLLHLLSSSKFRNAAIASMTGAGGLKRISEASIADTRVPVTDLAEQERIAFYLDTKISSVDGVRKKTLASIELLQEYRSSLIAATVTGQIDAATWRGDRALADMESTATEDAA